MLVFVYIIIIIYYYIADLAAVAEDSYNEDDDDSCGSTIGVGGASGPTPPDSPQMGRERVRVTRSVSYQYQYTGKIIPELDIYAISCKEGCFTLAVFQWLVRSSAPSYVPMNCTMFEWIALVYCTGCTTPVREIVFQ